MERGKVKRYKISKRKLGLLKKCFMEECTATQTCKIVNVNRNTANRYYNFFRDLIVEDARVERVKEDIGNGVELDESYFGPRRVRGKRGRGASRKVIVFGLLKRRGRVYTEIVPAATKAELMPIIRATVKSGSDIYTDGWRAYQALAVYGYNHKKVIHQKNEFAKEDSTHINGIESFWSWTKRRLHKFNGIRKEDFKRHLLESEWRFNHRDDKMKQLNRLVRAYNQKL